MADGQVLEEFVVSLGARVDEGSLRRMQASLQQLGQAVQQVQTALGGVQRAMGDAGKSFNQLAGKPAQDLAEITRKQKGQLEDLKKGIAEWGRSLSLTVGAFVGGMKSVANQYEQLGYAAQRAGTSAQNLLSMGEAMQKVGGQADDVTGAMQRMAATFRESPGEEQHALAIAGKYFDEIEKKVPGADQRTKEYLGILTEMKRYHEQNQDFMANALGREFFGWDDARSQQAINTYDDYIKRLNETKQRLDDVGLTQDRIAQITKQSQRFNNDLRDILLELHTAWTKAFSEVEPIIHPILTLLGDLLHAINKLPFGSLTLSIVTAVGSAKLLMSALGMSEGGGLLGLLKKLGGSLFGAKKPADELSEMLKKLAGQCKEPCEELGKSLGKGLDDAAKKAGEVETAIKKIPTAVDVVVAIQLTKMAYDLYMWLSKTFAPHAPEKRAKVEEEAKRQLPSWLYNLTNIPDPLSLLGLGRKVGDVAAAETPGQPTPQMQAGGIVRAALHEGEMVLPKNISEGLQRLYARAPLAQAGAVAEDLGRTFAKALQPVKEAIDGLEKKLPTKEELTTALGGGVKRLTDWVGSGSQVVVKNIKDFGNQFKSAFQAAATGQPATPGAAPPTAAGPSAAAAPEAAGPPPTPVQLPGGRPTPGGVPGLQMAPNIAIGGLRPGAPGTAVGGQVAQPTPQAWAAPPAPGAAGAPGAAPAQAGAAPTTFGGRVGAAVGGAAGAVARAVGGAAGAINPVAAAQASEAKWGIPKEVTLAQYQQESSWGTRMPPGSNNPFGIKAKPGEPYVEMHNVASEGGGSARFRKFDSLEQAFDEHAKLLATAPIYAEARKHKDDPAAFADALTGTYAEDKNYGASLKQIMGSRSFAQKLATGAEPQPGETPKGGGRIPYPVVGGGKVTTTEAPPHTDPQLFESAKAGFEATLPPGYTARVTSGFRSGSALAGGSQHQRGQALDWKIYDPDGKEVPNRGGRGDANWQMYRAAYIHSLAYMQNINPEKAATMSWGGHHATTDAVGNTETDEMHWDVGRQPRGQLMGGEKAIAADRAEAMQVAKAIQAGPPVMQAQRGGLIPMDIMGGIQPLLAHAGEMILPQALSQGLQSLIGGGGLMSALGGMATARLGGDMINNYGGNRNVVFNQTNTTNLAGGQPSSLAKYRDVHERVYGDLVRNFRAAMV